ncbi:CpsB/CapC family capsule biosynthesis tyrosine phosphatase [Thermoanaerobacterium sp. RBIITD]|uniref:tyrosine-protein phosphatase n=1 Tax=Thermoanaerobacterium sp. RBIITD TaxID=1550240 RepID=UPI000BC0DCC0|nr:CpsB/CapC family capsule biosynthesis tyrosine phosphatase [Thermoanaerobacterium sp. RBIITD]SNX55046.1 protein-tyrosine phosphatase [Thermoanaerobacterium sp. RBIITD]
MMVDIHCHIIPEIDDGAYDIDTSLTMANIAYNDGIKTIVATPHYIEYENEIKKDDILKKCDMLNNYIADSNIDVNILPGCEAYISHTLPSKYKEGSVMSINNTGRYILIELPMLEYPEYAEDVIFEFKLMGVTPIIAHIERYNYIKDDFAVAYKLIKKGALTQVNSTSITGLFGKGTMRKAIDLIKCNMVHFIASDAHTTKGRSPKIADSLTVLKDNGINVEMIDYIVANSDKVINGHDIDIYEPVLKKKNLLHKLFKF